MPNSITGQGTVLGLGEETTWGTFQTPDIFLDITEEGLEISPEEYQTKGLRGAGRAARPVDFDIETTRSAGGSFTVEVPTRGFGRVLKHTLGGTPTSAQQGATAAYKHTIAIGTTDGKGLTVQKQFRDAASTLVATFSYLGCKITELAFSMAVGEVLMAEVTIDSKDEVTNQAAATASYLTNAGLLSFSGAALTWNGNPMGKVTDWSMSIKNALNTDGYYLGSSGTKGEQNVNGRIEITGEITAEVDALTYYNAWRSRTAPALVATFEGQTIASTYKEMLRFTCPAVRFGGETPKAGGPEIITVSVPYTAYTPTDGSSAVTAEYQTRDVTI